MKQDIAQARQILDRFPTAEIGISSTKKLKQLDLSEYNDQIEELLKCSDEAILYATLTSKKIGEDSVLIDFLNLSLDILFTNFEKKNFDEQIEQLKRNTEELLNRLPALLEKIDDLQYKKILGKEKNFNNKKEDLKATINKFIDGNLKLFTLDMLDFYCQNKGQEDYKIDINQHYISNLWEESSGKEILAGNEDKVKSILSYTIESQDPYLIDLIASDKMHMPSQTHTLDTGEVIIVNNNDTCKAVRYTHKYLQGIQNSNFQQTLEGYAGLKMLNYLPEGTLDIMHTHLISSLTDKDILLSEQHKQEMQAHKKTLKGVNNKLNYQAIIKQCSTFYDNLDDTLNNNIDQILEMDLYKAAEMWAYMKQYEVFANQSKVIHKHIIKTASYQDLVEMQENLRRMEENLSDFTDEEKHQDYQDIITDYTKIYNQSLYIRNLKSSISGFIVLGIGAISTVGITISYVAIESIQTAINSSILKIAAKVSEEFMSIVAEKIGETAISSVLPVLTPIISIVIITTAIGMVISTAAESFIRYEVEKDKINKEIDQIIPRESSHDIT